MKIQVGNTETGAASDSDITLKKKMHSGYAIPAQTRPMRLRRGGKGGRSFRAPGFSRP